MSFKENALISDEERMRYAKNPSLSTPLASIVEAEFSDRSWCYCKEVVAAERCGQIALVVKTLGRFSGKSPLRTSSSALIGIAGAVSGFQQSEASTRLLNAWLHPPLSSLQLGPEHGQTVNL
jgi:hypothetical protein